ncbi:MAG: hypothetical protein ACXWZM_06795 [Solirubrobacterales bacterium]
MRFGRLIRDIVLIPLPLSLLAVAFFIAGIPEGGIVMALFALWAAWFIRPRKPQSVAASVPSADEEGIAPEVPAAGGSQGPTAP